MKIKGDKSARRRNCKTSLRLPVMRILTDRGTEFCGRVDQHDYQLYLAKGRKENLGGNIGVFAK
jgi:hypothetical protein